MFTHSGLDFPNKLFWLTVSHVLLGPLYPRELVLPERPNFTQDDNPLVIIRKSLTRFIRCNFGLEIKWKPDLKVGNYQLSRK